MRYASRSDGRFRSFRRSSGQVVVDQRQGDRQRPLHRQLDRPAADALARGVDRSQPGLAGVRGLVVGVDDLEARVGDLDAGLEAFDLALHPDVLARVQLAAQVRRVEPDQVEPGAAVVEHGLEARPLAVARDPAGRDLAPGGRGGLGLELGDGGLGLLALVAVGEVGDELGPPRAARASRDRGPSGRRCPGRRSGGT
jgi:hypothetical protein